MAEAKSLTILVVDDTAANRYMVSRVLSNAGFTMLEAVNAKEALELSLQQPDLIILDVQLPDINGFDLCMQLKDFPATGHIPILMTSAAFVQGHHKAHGLESGADGYLTTPIDPMELLATVRALLRIRESEEKLRKSQEIFRTMADSIPALVWLAGTDKQCYYFNKSWLDFTGRTLEQESGDGWLEGVYAEDEQSRRESYIRHFDQREPFEMEYRLKRHDGQYRWILNRGAPHYNLDGSFAGYTGACIDIHDKLTAEQKLQQSEERFDLAVKGLNDGLWDLDLHTNEIYYSPRYKSMLGYAEDEFANTVETSHQAIHPDDYEKAIEIVDKYLSSELSEYKNLFRMRHKNGEYRWILSRGIAVRDHTGKALRLVGAHSDVTEQQQLEQELREAYEKAESANNAKTDFLTNMSHEIRTPMNAIVGLGHILTTTPLSAKQKQCVTTLQLSSESLLSLINDMLDVAKIEDNMIELEQAPFSLRQVVDTVIRIMSVKANEKGLKLSVNYENEVTDWFTGDSLRIQQVLTNLLGNAVKFTQAGSISLYIAEHPGKEPALRRINVKVVDTGIGISPDKQQSIFEKFTQADTSITRQFGGSGLGLTITKALIEKIGGHIEVKSTPSEGSTFMFDLAMRTVPPAQDYTPAATQQKGKPSPQEQQKLILLVEDYPANILVATTMLEKFGYAFEVATDGLTAVSLVKTKSYDAVLMDIQMQGMDGYEATRAIRVYEQQQNRRPLPIIAMTAHALTGDKEKCLQAGMDDYISKPFNPSELQKKLASFLQKT